MGTLIKQPGRLPARGLVVIGVLAAVAPSFTRIAGAAEKPDPAAKPSPLEPLREAQRHFFAGVTLYEEKDLRGALAEFKTAYATDPLYRVLYNLGLVARELNDWAGALGYYRKFLDDGEERVPPGRRLQVEREILELAQRVARLQIDLRDGPAEVQIDDEPIASARLAAPIAVNPGKHRVRVAFPKHPLQVRVVELAGGEEKGLVFELGPAPAHLDERLAKAVRAAATKDENPPNWPTRQVDAPPSRLSTYTWIATGVLLVGGGVVGYLARESSQQLVRDRMRYPVDGAMLGSERSRTQMLSTAADGLLIGGALFAVVSGYLTFAHSSDEGAAPGSHAHLAMPAGTLSMSGAWSF
jgi:hypothetical protein